MTNRNRSTRVVPAILGVALIAGTAVSADLDTTGQAGQYANSLATVRVKGAVGDFAPSTIHVPFILLNNQALAGQPALVNARQAFINTPQVQTVNGNPVAYLTSFFTDPANTAADRTLTVLGTTDAAGGGVSNNVVLSEIANKSDSPGAITKDGTIVHMARFGSGQNNLGVFPGVTGVNPQVAAPPIQAGSHIFDVTAVGIGNAAEAATNPNSATVLGSVFIGTPGADRTAGGTLYTGQTHFNGNPALTAAQFAAAINGVAVYDDLANDPRAGTAGSTSGGSIGPGTAAGWLQESVPLPTNPPGETRTDARQTQPAVKVVRTPSGAEVVYVAHGIGFSGSTPFTGGSARCLMLVVDQLRPNYAGGNATPENNSIIIEADAVGGVGTAHGRPYTLTFPSPAGFADHWNTDANLRFVDHVATGGAADVSSVSRFDMNGKGQVVALLEDRNVSPSTLQIRVYNPTWNAAQDRITGYTLGAIVATSGDVGNLPVDIIALSDVRTTIESSPGTFVETGIDTISGVAIDDDGRVAFVGMTAASEITGDWDFNMFTPDTRYLQNSTNSLFVWEPTTNSIHRIVRGGQAGDTLTDSFPGGGAGFVDNSLAVGVFATGSSETDAFGRGGFSQTGGYLAIAFRSCGNEFSGGANREFETRPDLSIDTFIDRGGSLFAPGQLGINDRSARGALVIKLGAFAAAPPCCPGNANKVAPGAVNFDDITAVLGNWNANYGAGTGPGDANCDGIVNFDDITSVLSNWLANCP